MSDLRELYQQVILDHSRSPRNLKKPESANRTAEGNNPLCGDQLTLYLDVADGVVRDIGFEGSGCAISRASASLMTESVSGKTLDEVQNLFEGFHKLLTGSPGDAVDEESLGKLIVFGGVREFPVRVKCATLAWHTLRAALEQASEPVSTE